MKHSLLDRCEQHKILRDFSTFRIGGPARYFLEVTTLEELVEAIRVCAQEKIPYILLGKGSNTLFDDRGFCGLVILNKILGMKLEGESVWAGAGYSFSLLGVQMARQGLSGLEFASGIPGSIGGAVFMNAGANGGDIAQVLSSVTYITEEGEIERLDSSQITFGYRFTSFHEKKGAIADATFRLQPLPEARAKQLEIIEYRKKTQPYGEPSAGCVFRNPMPTSAGALIDRCGLKGKQVGGAEVSTLHANFIINKGGATASDVIELAALIKSEVLTQTGVDLEMEIRPQPYNPGGFSS